MISCGSGILPAQGDDQRRSGLSPVIGEGDHRVAFEEFPDEIRKIRGVNKRGAMFEFPGGADDGPFAELLVPEDQPVDGDLLDRAIDIGLNHNLEQKEKMVIGGVTWLVVARR